MVNATSKESEMEFPSYHLKHFERCKWLRPCSVYSHSLLNSNGKKSYARTSSAEPSQIKVLTQIRKSCTYAAAQGRGGEGKLIPSARSKQGQKICPYSQHISENRQRKLSPKKAHWKES